MCPKSEGVNVEVNLFISSGRLRAKAHFCQPADQAAAHEMLGRIIWGLTAGVFKHTPCGEYFSLDVYVQNVKFEMGPDPFDLKLPGGRHLVANSNVFKFLRVRHVEEEVEEQ